MGFKNSPSIFQRIMDKVLEDEIGKCCYVYVDDIIIFSKNKSEHIKDSIKIFEKLIGAGLTANKKKLEICKESVAFLGFKVSNKRIESLIDKKKAILDFPIPKDKTDIKSFLGMVNHHRKFIPNCADKLFPLQKLLKKRKI
ncbi:Retrovirus-related Pol polyprotein from transposon gypsy [Nosema granulosis]|uniref:Retrovirus-related Pol polyprotein from transposon gypsy n=1 Tax=Nosema granulosis TaxID=83296 RepID=A0A9P6GWL8_9MICR|nr:Retrovirus-related Pol polyprotein from transposon gypsy [Nosema granulosis]